MREDRQQQRIKRAVAMPEGIKPQGEIEGMPAARIVTTQSAATACLRRAMIPGQSFEGPEQNLRRAATRLSLHTRQIEVLDRRRGKGQQYATLE